MRRPTIVEVLRRSVQGKSEPFICRADDGHIYYVKGLHAGRESQIKEWLCANLAAAFGLPIAPFAVVEVPEALISARLLPDIRQLGSGAAFGSRAVESSVWLNRSHLVAVPPAQQQDVLAFDWWVHNADRTLTEQGGNPNLLWDEAGGQLVVIDHNLAFDAGFDAREFLSSHVFSAAAPEVFDDFLRRADIAQRLTQALTVWNEACAGLPPEWRYNDLEATLPCRFDLDAAYRHLQRAGHENFWSITS